jgi:hypothetical protein
VDVPEPESTSPGELAEGRTDGERLVDVTASMRLGSDAQTPLTRASSGLDTEGSAAVEKHPTDFHVATLRKAYECNI